MFKRALQKMSPVEIKPKGFMKRQLELQAVGLTGHLPSLWTDLSDQSAWLGGRGESWERGPYYLDGLVPLAYLLDDSRLIAEVDKWITAIIDSRQASGFFGPPWNSDWWPRVVVMKALVSYYRATKDRRVLGFMQQFFKHQDAELDCQPPYFWASARALEAAEAIELVCLETGDPQTALLAEKLKTFMFDWFGSFKSWPYCRPTNIYLNRRLFNLAKGFLALLDRMKKTSRKIKPPESAARILAFNRQKLVKIYSFTHGVNTAMAIKYPAAYDLLAGRDSYFELSRQAYRQLMACHGTALGIWSGDEHLNGSSPTAGIELCSVVELLYSFSELLSITGDPRYADLIELVGYNALPATFTADMCCHQYLQQVNQVAADRKRRRFYDAGPEATVYGLKPNYGCCAANLHQGFPKLVLNACFKTDQGLAFMVYMPCIIKTKSYAGQEFVIRQLADYPFEDKVVFEIMEGENLDLTLSFRIPAYTEGKLFFNGQPRGRAEYGLIKLQEQFRRGDVIELILDTPLQVVNNPDQSISIRKGSLLLALKIEEELKVLRGKEPFNYRQYLPRSAWNLAPLLVKGALEVLEITRRALSAKPFDPEKPPLEVKVRGVEVKNWCLKENSAGPYPKEPDLSEPMAITLVPYGSTNIRTAQFPRITNELPFFIDQHS